MTERAAWAISVGKRSVDPDGAARIVATLSDRGVKQGDIVIELSAKRDLRVEWHDAPGSAGLAGFTAWAKEV